VRTDAAAGRDGRTSAARVRVADLAGRGRGVVASEALLAGTLVSELGGPPFAATPLQSVRTSRCAHCFGAVRDVLAPLDERGGGAFADRATPAPPVTCVRCGYVHYCSAECRDADASQHGRQCAHLCVGGALRALDTSVAPCVLGRLGVLLLAGRCLWRRHDEARSESARTRATGASALSSKAALAALRPTARHDAAIYDMLVPGPTSDADYELAQLAASLTGLLPPGAVAANVVSLLGSFRCNQFQIASDRGASLGVGCFPRLAMLNHSCAPKYAPPVGSHRTSTHRTSTHRTSTHRTSTHRTCTPNPSHSDQCARV
jgi:hypothetical protein